MLHRVLNGLLHRVVVSRPAKLRHIAGAYWDAWRKSHPMPSPPPEYTRGDILLDVRMEGPVAPVSMEPLPDED